MDKPKHFVDPYVEKLKMEGRKSKTNQEFIPSTQTMLTKSGDAMLTSDDSFDQSGKSTHIMHVINSPFTVVVPSASNHLTKEQRSKGGHARSTCIVIFRILLLVAILYFFICSLALLSDAFTLLGGKILSIHHRDVI